MLKYIREKAAIERYNRAKRLMGKVNSEIAKKSLQKAIDYFETESAIIDYVTNHPNLEERIDEHKNSKDGKVYVLEVNLIIRYKDNFEVCPSKIIVQKIGSCYVESWRNVGNDHHTYHISTSKRSTLDYWESRHTKFLLYQLQNQDKLEEICKDLQLLNENYFAI